MTVTLKRLLKHSERPSGTTVTTVVLHHTAGASALSTIEYLRKPLVMASYHYIVERDGTVYKCVPASKKAWHCGVSSGPNGKDVNRYSVGVAFANKGDGEEYPDAQLVAAGELIRSLRKQFPRLYYITSHRLITKRKIDPAYFDFVKFADGMTGLTTWMDESLRRPWNG